MGRNVPGEVTKLRNTVVAIPRVHTRKLDRGIARRRMQKKGLVHVAKHERGQKSWFSAHWREYAY